MLLTSIFTTKNWAKQSVQSKWQKQNSFPDFFFLSSKSLQGKVFPTFFWASCHYCLLQQDSRFTFTDKKYYKLYGILVSWPGIEPSLSGLEGEVLTTGQPENSFNYIFKGPKIFNIVIGTENVYNGYLLNYYMKNWMKINIQNLPQFCFVFQFFSLAISWKRR